MQDRIIIKRSRKFVNGKLVSEEVESSQAPVALQAAQRGGVITANQFVADSIESNRLGRLSPRQFLEGWKTILFFASLTVGLISLIATASLGFGSIKSHNYLASILPCTGTILVFLFVAWLMQKVKTSSMERYWGDNPFLFVRRLLLPLDLLMGRVSQIEGNVTASTRETPATKSTGGIRDEIDHSRAPSTYQYYQIEGREFATTSAGYSEFPPFPMQCRIYYLPLSSVMVNLEIMGE